MAKYLGLVRVSTRVQGDSRNGLEGQRAELVRWAEYHGHELVTILEEVGSGGLQLSDRPVLSMALSMAKKMKCCVLTTKVDRCSRVASIANELISTKKVVTIETGDVKDEFVTYLQAGLAARERSVGAGRTKAGMAAAKARGVVMGNRKNLPEAQRIGREVIKGYADDFAIHMKPTLLRMVGANMTYKEIAEELTKLRVKTARNNTVWYASSVCTIITRCRLMGV